jgi:small subunit ribosomal protein S21
MEGLFSKFINQLLEELKERAHYEKPTTERKRKRGAAQARWRKKLRDQQLPKKLY